MDGGSRRGDVGDHGLADHDGAANDDHQIGVGGRQGPVGVGVEPVAGGEALMASTVTNSIATNRFGRI